MARMLLILVLTTLVITISEANPDLPPLSWDPSEVYEPGKYTPNDEYYYPHEKPGCTAPTGLPLLIVTPEESGRYPVIMFHHGTNLKPYWYSLLLRHVASHGYIIVAPQLYRPGILPPSTNAQDEINGAAAVANWLVGHLNKCIPEGIEADLTNLSISGHSRGGYIAYAVALGLANVTLNIPISSIAAMPVVGLTVPFDMALHPHVLTGTPCSLPLSIPLAIIGSEFGGEGYTPCAPPKYSMAEFYSECKPPCARFIVQKYGHMDVLDDNMPSLSTAEHWLCQGHCARWNRACPARDRMRRTVGGIMVAFYKSVLRGDSWDYSQVLRHPESAPAGLETFPKNSCKKSEAEAGSSMIFSA